MTDRFESILDECISALQAGVSIEDILAEVPDYADELRPLLYAATVLADPNPKLVPEERKSALRAMYMQQIATLPSLSAPTFWEKTQAIFRIMQRRLTPTAVLNDLATIIITVLLTLVMAALIVNYLATDAIPGDFLYGAKRFSETVQLSFAPNEGRQTELREKFNQRRLQEIEQLIEQNRAAVVQFRGILETKGDNLWVVAGHTIFLPPDIEIEKNIHEGDTVEIIGLLRANNRVLIADTISVVK
ncbi:MAG: hypothetical protein JW953_12475 [Anaerolineae bacterium]|nr:hypothetical protein [Anaerolineae bacterium]